MQRITRLPLLILAILNRTPLDHPDHDVVEKTLRSVQKVKDPDLNRLVLLVTGYLTVSLCIQIYTSSYYS
jgi:hypothetical protein